jgi:hypothetical protein
MSKEVKLAALLFCFALAVRVGLFFTVFHDLQHGSAATYGSAALGIYNGVGNTVNHSEIQALRQLQTNLHGELLTMFHREPRMPQTEFLPGPAVLLASLWHVIPIYNFAPYLIIQSVADAILIALVGFLLARKNFTLAVFTAGIMVINLPVIRRTLMMGYDFWPQFAVLVLFVGVLALERWGYKAWQFLLIGLLSSVPIWCRDITTPLPFFIAALLVYILRTRERMGWVKAAGKTMLFLGPIILSIALLAQYRYETTGNYRPTRSTFWHSFMAGVGQFSNPYGIVHNDRSVWEFAKKVDPALEGESLARMYQMPNSPYEILLKEFASDFVVEHTALFVRNALYRAAIIISPPLYRDGDFLPRSFSRLFFPLGFMLLPLWFIGIVYLRRNFPLIFLLSVVINLYFIAAFSWFYVVGRVVLPLLFINAMVWISGILFLDRWFRDRYRKLST